MFHRLGSQNPAPHRRPSCARWRPNPVSFLCLILVLSVLLAEISDAQDASLTPAQWLDRRSKQPAAQIVYGRRPPKKYRRPTTSQKPPKQKPKTNPPPPPQQQEDSEISETLQNLQFQPVNPLDGLKHLNLPSSLPHLDSLKHLHIEPVLPLDPLKEAALKLLAQHHQPPPPYKKVKHHHYHPIVLYKKKRIPGKYWHEAQRRLVTKHGGLDVLGDITQLNNGKVLAGNFGQNIPNFNDGFFKPWELQERLLRMQRDLLKALMRQLIRLLRNPPQKGLFLVKEIDLLD